MERYDLRPKGAGKVLLLLLALLSVLGTGSDGCLLDADGDGYTVAEGDCNDSDAAVFPGAQELCDGVDNDCDGDIDEGVAPEGYLDLDEDGFGSEVATSCLQPTAPARGDCNDGDPRIHPGATDEDGDGVDQDCGGTSGPDPSVGLEASTFTSIQAAIDASVDGQTVWIGPGRYLEHGVTLEGKAIAVRSTGGAENTVIDAEGQGTVFYGRDGETTRSVLDGFTLTGGSAQEGGAVYLFAASPTLTHVTVTGNTATSGGGIFMYQSSPALTHVTVAGNTANAGGGLFVVQGVPILTDVAVKQNRAANAGGGLHLSSATPTLTQVAITGNEAATGGGLGLWEYAQPTMTNVTIRGNSASYDGGGLYANDAGAILTHVDVTGNTATYGGGISLTITASAVLKQVTIAGNAASQEGGGMRLLNGSTATMSHVTVRDNSANSGAGMFLASARASLTNVVLSGNIALENGGGMFLWYASPSLTHVNVVGNAASGYGGGMFLDDLSSPSVVNSIIAYNTGTYNVDLESGTPIFAYCNVYDPLEGNNAHGLELDATNLVAEPQFLETPTYDPDANLWRTSDLHLALDSPLVDAGDPERTDPDGSRSDMGIYGGLEADGWDRDGDTFPDYFWPGTLEDVPQGFDVSDYDRDDSDPTVH